MKLLVATPMYEGSAVAGYTNSILELAGKIPFARNIISNDCYIDQARENSAKTLMANDFTHMMFFDADMSFNADDVMAMLHWAQKPGYEVIGAGYPKKEINWERIRAAALSGVPADKLEYHGLTWCFCSMGQKGYKLGEPEEAKFVPTGVMVISRKVFEQLPRPWFDAHWERDGDDWRFIGEDVDLCNKWRAAGNKVWLAPWVRTEHVGKMTFHGDMSKL